MLFTRKKKRSGGSTDAGGKELKKRIMKTSSGRGAEE